LSFELSLDGFNLKSQNRQIKSSLRLRLETSHVNTKHGRKNIDVVQPFQVSADLDQEQERISAKVEVE
jgi:hypothetical protein